MLRQQQTTGGKNKDKAAESPTHHRPTPLPSPAIPPSVPGPGLGPGTVRSAVRGLRELTLPHPVVIRMPAPVVERMLKDRGDSAMLQDPEGYLSTRRL
ncbi:hypothetical protein [Streptomyces avermitilis]|uniref:hypothetical protein n=1 Tax=Streptomyces avermitilis TaxID=33903 RepID=UPI0038274228